MSEARWFDAIERLKNEGFVKEGSHSDVVGILHKTDSGEFQEEPVIPVVVYENFGQPENQPITIFQRTQPVISLEKLIDLGTEGIY